MIFSWVLGGIMEHDGMSSTGYHYIGYQIASRAFISIICESHRIAVSC